MWNVNTARRRAVLKRLREKELKDWYVKQMFLKEREGSIPSVQAMSESYFCSELLVWEKKWEEIYYKIWWLLWLLMFLVTISRRIKCPISYIFTLLPGCWGKIVQRQAVNKSKKVLNSCVILGTWLLQLSFSQLQLCNFRTHSAARFKCAPLT